MSWVEGVLEPLMNTDEGKSSGCKDLFRDRMDLEYAAFFTAIDLHSISG